VAQVVSLRTSSLTFQCHSPPIFHGTPPPPITSSTKFVLVNSLFLFFAHFRWASKSFFLPSTPASPSQLSTLNYLLGYTFFPVLLAFMCELYLLNPFFSLQCGHLVIPSGTVCFTSRSPPDICLLFP